MNSKKSLNSKNNDSWMKLDITLKELIFDLTIWVLLFIVYYILLLERGITIHESLVISFMTSGVFKTLYDIKYRTGSTRFYAFSESTNQKLRYFTFLVLCVTTIFYHFILFNKLF